MTIEWDQPPSLPPLKPQAQPLVAINSMLAVNDVHLPAADVPRGLFRQFYESTLGLKFVPPAPPEPSAPATTAPADETIQFLHHRRRIILSRTTAPPGHAAFVVKDFSDVLLRLRSRTIPYELFHIDNGLTRMALLRDPAANWVHLVETRDF